MKKNKVKIEIDRLIAKYPWSGSNELFRMELEYLVLIAEREQMIRDREIAVKPSKLIIKKKGEK